MAKEAEDFEPTDDETEFDKNSTQYSEACASNVDLSEIFKGYEGLRKPALQKVISEANQNNANTLPPLGDDMSFHEYMDEHRGKINGNETLKNLFSAEFNQIAESEALAVREAMKSHGEQVLKFDSPEGGSVSIKGSCDLEYTKSGRLKIIHPKTEIDASQAPLCLSLPLQDENGRNMKENGAQYLFINYGDDGKISHISHPEPIKIENGRCSYEINGKPYYLKIESQALEALKMQIDVNNGRGIAQDTAVKGSKEVAEKMRRAFSGEQPGEKNGPEVVKPVAPEVEVNGSGPDPDPVAGQGAKPPPPPRSKPSVAGQGAKQPVIPSENERRNTPGVQTDAKPQGENKFNALGLRKTGGADILNRAYVVSPHIVNSGLDPDKDVVKVGNMPTNKKNTTYRTPG